MIQKELKVNNFSNAFVADEKNQQFLRETMWGPNGIRQAEELASHFPIPKNAKILDLGCGTGLSALYLVKEHNATVFATDLYADPTENHQIFKSIGIADKAIPMTLDATQPMPFAKGYFDVIFSVGAYNMFGDNENALSNIIPYAKKGGYIAVSFPGLKKDFGGNIPTEMKPFLDVVVEGEKTVAHYIRGIDWWEKLFRKSKEWLEYIELSEQKCHDIAWQEYLASRDPSKEEEKWDLDMMEAEAGKYYNTIQFVARVV